jgi:hypothetical protein
MKDNLGRMNMWSHPILRYCLKYCFEKLKKLQKNLIPNNYLQAETETHKFPNMNEW